MSAALADRWTGASGGSVVLLHGWSADSRIWTPLMAAYGNRIRFGAPDLPGHGRSPLDMRCGPEQFHGEVVARFGEWSRNRDVAEAPMVAWAWGARVLVDAIASGVVAPSSVMLVCLPPVEPVPSPFDGPLSRDWPRYIRSIVRLMTAKPLSPELEGWLAAVMWETSPAAAGSIHASGWTVPDAAFRLPAGSMTIFGKGDRIGSPKDGAATVEPWAPDRIEMMDDVGHTPFVEAPDRFAALLFEWLEKVGVQ